MINERQDGTVNNLLQKYSRVVLSAEQIDTRVRELARQISNDYRGRAICVVGVLENGFMFMADLVRHLEVPVICQFLKVDSTPTNPTKTDIFFSPEPDVKGQDVLLVEVLVQSGLTSDFLLRNLMGRGASSVKLAALLDKQSARRIALQPDYFGFLMDEGFVVGYGLGAPEIGRNLPYIAAKERKS
jgi:hypoxanthine phosphoribosyltransferase